jgi:peroxiredoxin
MIGLGGEILPDRDVEEVLAEICVMDAPLWRRMELYVETQRAHGIPFAAASDRLVARLKEGEVGRDAPGLGAVMPEFLLPDQRGRLVRLSELTAAGPVVLSFNRGHWCPFCRLELNALADAHAELVGLGASVVSIMPDRQVFLGRLPREVVRRLTILADVDSAYALSLGLTMWLGDELKGLMLGFGLSLEEVHGNACWIVPLPATFVLDGDGRVVARKVEAEFRQRLSVEEIKAALAAIETRGAGKT